MADTGTPHTLAELLGPDAAAHMSRLRAEEPVCPVRLPNGDSAWLVTRYDDVATVLSDTRFSRVFSPGGGPRPGDRASAPNSRDTTTRTLGMDGRPHRTLRAVVNTAFAARRVEEMVPFIQELADGLVAGMRRLGKPVDLVEHFASPLPIMVICKLLGVPAEDAGKFRAWSDRTLSVTAYPRDEVVQAWQDLFAYFAKAVASKREQPGDDLLSAMIAASELENKLTELELVYLATGLLIGGHESTINAIALSVWRLLQFPDQVAKIRADRTVIGPAVEELLRYQTLGDVDRQRFAQEDVELSGVTVRAGEMLLAGVMSANRDPERFDDPEDLDVTRSANPHLSFGQGPHYCLGAALARTELQVALGTLLREFPGLRSTVPADEVRWKTGLMVRGLEEFVVTW